MPPAGTISNWMIAGAPAERAGGVHGGYCDWQKRSWQCVRRGGGRGAAGGGDSGRPAFFTPPEVEAQSAPATPGSVSVTRSGSTLTASWDAPAGATKYHATYSSDNGNSWTAIGDNLTGNGIGVGNTDPAKTYIVAVRAGNQYGWSGWRNSDPIAGIPPPAAPGTIAITRADGSLAAQWDAVADATKYHVTYSSNNRQSWQSPVCGDSCSNNVTITADNQKTYVVAVRAGNDGGWSGWSHSAPSGPFGPQPPASPASVAVSRGNGTLTASGYGVSGATKYHVTYSADGGKNWNAAPCGNNCAGASVTISSVDNAQAYIVAVRAGNSGGWSGWRNSAASGPSQPPAAPAQVTFSRNCDGFSTSWTPSSGATGYDVNTSSDNRKSWQRALSNVEHNVWVFAVWKKDKPYRIAVRARNSAGESGWTNSAVAHPPSREVSSLRAVTATTHGTAGGSITTTWNAGQCAESYNVNYRPDGGQWQRIQSGVTGATHTGTVTKTGGHTVAVQSVDSITTSKWRNLRVDGWLTAGGITGSGATLTLAGHSGNWYVKQTAPAPAGTCSSAISGATHTLSGLSPITAYTFAAYADSGCANLIARATFTTGGVSVSNMSETSRDVGLSVLASDLEANAFTTGDHEDGYTLDRVVIKFRDALSEPGTFTAAIHTVSAGSPAAEATYTLSGNTTPTTAGDYVYTCSGTCSLGKETTYFLMLSGTSPAYSVGAFWADSTLSDSETNTPSNAGWSIANQAKYKRTNSAWQDETSNASVMFQVIANKRIIPTLSAGSITISGATLTIGKHTAQWWYTADKGPHTTCQGPVAANTSSKTLTGLSPVETYTYSAYGASGCADANLLTTAAAFTTGGVSVSNMSETSRDVGLSVLASDLEANAFTTGDHEDGYTLDRVVIKFRDALSEPGTFTAAIHTVSAGSPAAEATYTLSGNTTPTTAGDYVYTCSGTCSLGKETTYFLMLSGTSPAYSVGAFWADSTLSDSETNTPSNAGWSIANQAKYKRTNSAWQDETSNASVMFQVVATEK